MAEEVSVTSSIIHPQSGIQPLFHADTAFEYMTSSMELTQQKPHYDYRELSAYLRISVPEAGM